jgi:hypothetical protein
MIDYARYANNGFFLTEASFVSFEYMPIGSVFAEIGDGYKMVDIKADKMVTTQGIQVIDQSTYEEEPTYHSVYDVLDLAVEKAREGGADGIIGLTITVTDRLISMETTNSTYYTFDPAKGRVAEKKGRMFMVMGMAIKRR